MEDREKLVREARNDGIIVYEEHLGFKCTICRKIMSGIISAGEHLANSKHTEAGARVVINNPHGAPASLMRLLSPDVMAAVEEHIIQAVELQGGSAGLLCKVCDKLLTGLAPLQQHLQGSDHRKKLNRPRLASLLQRPPGSNNTLIHLPNGAASDTNCPSPYPYTGNWVPNNETFNPWSQEPYTRGQLPTSQNQVPTEVTFHNQYHAPNEKTSHIWSQMPIGTTSNTWSQISDVRNQVPNSCIQIPCGTLSPTPSWNENPATPSRTSMEAAQPSKPMSPLSVGLMDASPRPAPTQLLPSSPMSLMQPQTENRLSNAATSLSFLAEQDTDGQFIRYNAVARRNECIVCQLPVPGDSMGISLHVKSKGHREESVRYAIENPANAPQCLLDLLPQGAVQAARVGILFVNQNRTLQCRPCDRVFTGVPPLREHLVSFDHRKKTGNLTLEEQASNLHFRPTDGAVIDELTQAFEEGLVICTDNSSDQVICNICNVPLNGRKNLEDHLNGKKHLKKLREQAMQNQNVDSQRSRRDGSLGSRRNSSAMPETEPTADRDPSIPAESPEEIHPVLMPYSVKSVPRGQVYIFNYLFTGRTEDPKERKGARHDSVNLMNTFSRMGYQVFCYEDLTTDETNKKLDDIRQDRALNQIDVLVMFFLSHGNQPFQFYVCDQKELDLRDIWDKFTDSACPSMKRKPKIFFANFCRGKDEEMPETDAKIDVPRDMVTIHASSERITALRSPKHGTHFVRALCHILENDAKTLDLREIYHKLDFEVKHLGGRQPKWEDTRFRKFYFNPIY